ncbi:MAG: UDP-galactopyranose mutase [Elusimicrobiales bacterium]|jgi:UDP-galactopyranose mutase|nr:UDP-galactopyranose mutase [Elusimicrobiales bacterium]
MKKNNILIIGSGITGLTLAERFASVGDNVLLIEKRNHIGGNCYDFKNKSGILIQKYGPHIFHTKYKDVWDYLSGFTDWIGYEHRVLGYIDEKFVPIPFNLTSLHKLLPEKAEHLKKKLIKTFGYAKRISILDLKKYKDNDLTFLSDFVYKKVFLEYNLKQWDKKPEEIDSMVVARVPVVISEDDRYFSDKYQGIPEKGFTAMFKNMVSSRNICIKLNYDYKKLKDLSDFKSVFYTGPIDEFFNYKYGKLNYRCLNIKFKTLNREEYQPAAVVNYPDLKYPYTRITEFKKLTHQKHKKTTIGIESSSDKGILGWPLLDDKNKKIFQRYWQETEKLEVRNIYFIGRLAEYKYYNIDEAVKRSLDLFNTINYGGEK